MQQQRERVEELERFLTRYYRDDVATLAQRYPREQQSLTVDYHDIEQFDHRIADDLVEAPTEIIGDLETALSHVDLPADVSLSGARVQITNLRAPFEVDKVSRHDNIGRLVATQGQVSKTSAVNPKLTEACYECLRCGSANYLAQSGTKRRTPHECSGCERQGPFSLDPSRSKWTNHQLARLQEPPEQTNGTDGEDIDIHLEGDLVGSFRAGDRVTTTGVVEIADGDGDTTVCETRIAARGVTREETDYDDIDIDEHREEIESIAAGERGDPYELLVDSINPKHYGDETVKLALALQLFGGWAHNYPDGSRDRGDWHILMLGDPGCGKSTFLKFINEIAPRATYASGKGASAAGMTAAAVNDGFGSGEWSLEAGAMVLADGGVACVDEIDKMHEDAVSSMHEALESQQVHVSKAGINATLRARTSLLAAGNPEHGRFDSFQSIPEQINLEPALLSRFDLYFMVSDNPDPDEDRDVVDHMLNSRRASGRYTRDGELRNGESEVIEPAISKDVLRAYVAHAKQTSQPILEDDEAAQRLKDFFVGFRSAAYDDADNPVPITFRQVEGIQRIAEASARVRLSDTVELADIERAVKLVQYSMRQVGYDPEAGEFDADVVETGTSRSQRERERLLESIITDEDGIEEKKAIDAAQDDGMDRGRARGTIQSMKNKGLVYEDGYGKLRVP